MTEKFTQGERGIEERQAQEVRHGDTIFTLVGFVEHCLFHIGYLAGRNDWLKQDLAVPRKFVEKSRRTTALAVLNEWLKQEGE